MTDETSSKPGKGTTPSGTERGPPRNRGSSPSATTIGGMCPALTQRIEPSAGSTIA